MHPKDAGDIICITGASDLTLAEKKTIFNIVNSKIRFDDVVSPQAGPQNCQTCWHFQEYGDEGDWAVYCSKAPWNHKFLTAARRGMKIGMPNPSEKTFTWIIAILMLADCPELADLIPDGNAAKELRSNLTLAWASTFKNRRIARSMKDFPKISDYKANFPEMYAKAYPGAGMEDSGALGPVPSKVSYDGIKHVYDYLPTRNTHMTVRAVAALSRRSRSSSMIMEGIRQGSIEDAHPAWGPGQRRSSLGERELLALRDRREAEMEERYHRATMEQRRERLALMDRPWNKSASELNLDSMCSAGSGECSVDTRPEVPKPEQAIPGIHCATTKEPLESLLEKMDQTMPSSEKRSGQACVLS